MKSDEIPFERGSGKLLNVVPPHQRDAEDIVWRPNYTFSDTLRFTGYRPSDGQVYATSVTTEFEYPFAMGDFFGVLRTRTIDRGVVTARWTFRKSGNRYSLRLVEEDR